MSVQLPEASSSLASLHSMAMSLRIKVTRFSAGTSASSILACAASMALSTVELVSFVALTSPRPAPFAQTFRRYLSISGMYLSSHICLR